MACREPWSVGILLRLEFGSSLQLRDLTYDKLPAVWHRMPARVYCAAIVPDAPILDVLSCINHGQVSYLVLFHAPSSLPDTLWPGKSIGPNVSQSPIMSRHSVSRHLRLAIDDYDETIRRFVPGYDAMLAAVAREFAPMRPHRILDLGGGTGSLTHVLLAHGEVENIDLIDVDPEMLARARIRLARFGKRVCLRDISFFSDLPLCNGVASSLALHHIATRNVKTDLYRRIYRALQPGGLFVNADVTMPRREPERRQTYRLWIDHMMTCGINEERAWQHLAEWEDEDTYFALEEELADLGTAGFRSECVWRVGPMAVMVGRKDSPA